jgi:hypothetical protein
MQLFSRIVMLTGPYTEVNAWASDMRQYVSEKWDREIGLWSVMFGAPLGTLVYSARVAGLADVQSIGATLSGDPDYHAKLGDPPPVGSVAVVTTATIANGAYTEAITWGVEMAQYVEGVTGFGSTFLVDDFGPFGQVRWMGVAPDAASADAAGQKLNADPGYLEKLSATGDLFVQGSGNRGLAARVA